MRDFSSVWSIFERKNVKKALNYLKIGAKSGMSHCLFALGVEYLLGRFIPQDIEQVKFYFLFFLQRTFSISISVGRDV